MVDSFVSFSNANSMDLFPSFKSFHEPKDDQRAFTTDNRDIEQMQTPIPENPVEKAIKPKRNTPASIANKPSPNPIVQCDICSVPLSSQIVYDTHIKGRKHQTQLTALLVKNPQYKAATYQELLTIEQVPKTVINESEKPVVSVADVTVKEKDTTAPLIPSKKLNCNTCNVSCNSQQMFDNHVSGKRHQMKIKLKSFTSPAPPRIAPDNNPSSSNYCDVCSIQLNSDNELTDHLAQKRHQTRVKEAEVCTKEAADLNINFDDYKISASNTEKPNFDYQCTKCNKKIKNKVQLIDHLKSALHTRLANRTNDQQSSIKVKREDYQPPRGRGVIRGETSTRGRSFSSFRGSNKPTEKSRPYRSQNSSWNQPLPPSIDQRYNPTQETSNNPFGAFDRNNQSTFVSNNTSYSQTKRSTQYEEKSNEYDAFFPKRMRTYNDEGDTSQKYYSTEGNYYPSNSTTYSSQTSVAQPSWQYQTEPQYDQQQYSTNSGSTYTNPIHYPSNQPPLPSYEPPPVPSYPPPSSYNRYGPNPTFPSGTGINSLENGLLRQPPMGWLTWQRFRCVTDCQEDPDTCISEKLIRTQAQLLVQGGYLAAGYEYIIIDDCWLNHSRAADGSLQPDNQRFPSGIRALADYVHSLGLKFGIYEDYGTETCAGYPGVLGHLEQDAKTFASWTVDYLKLDGCNVDVKAYDAGYPAMEVALNSTGFPIAFSCSWPAYQEFSKIKPNYSAIAQTCNLWRNWADIDDSWDSVRAIIQWFGDNQDRLSPFHGPGHWNDPDMLVIGNYGLSPGQSRAQMALWSIMAAPLILSVDLRTISDWARDILLNKNLIAINQDPLGAMGRRILQLTDDVQVWSKPLKDDRTAFVALYSEPYGTPIHMSISLSDLGLGRYQDYNFFDSFNGSFLGKFHYTDKYNFQINPAGDVHAFYAESDL